MNIQGGHYYLIRFVMEIDEERLLGPLFFPRRAFSDCFPQLFSFPPFTHCKRGRKGEKLLADILRLLLSTATLPSRGSTPSPAAIIQVEGAHEIRN